MSTMLFGAAFARAFDPTTDFHYCLSEDAQLELRMMFDAMRTLAHVLDPNPGERVPDIEGQQIAPLFYSFAAHGHRIIADMPGRHPNSRANLNAAKKGAAA